MYAAPTAPPQFISLLTLRNDRVSLPDDIYELLVHYYNATYDWDFVTIAGASDKLALGEKSEDCIVVLPNIIQHERIRIGSEIFGRILHPDIEKIRTYWQSLYKITKQSIHFPVKFNFSLHCYTLVLDEIMWHSKSCN